MVASEREGSPGRHSEPEPLPVLLRRWRLASGLSQEALAEKSGLSVNGIAQLETGKRTRPRAETLRLLAEALGLDPRQRSEMALAAHPDRAPAARARFTSGFRSSLDCTRPPIPPNALIGRAGELSDVRFLLREAGTRLVTMTGPGGIGKTRLALEVASSLSTEFADGVAWADLSSVRETELVVPLVARAVGMKEKGRHALLDQLCAFLAHRSLLLVLDNCEHVLPAMTLPASLLASSPGLKVLATSRERLHLRGEREIRLEPLEVPPPPSSIESPPEPGKFTCVPAVQLFIERAGETPAGFALTVENVAAVSEVCRRLDGIPLAIELAAGRSHMFSPEALLNRLDPLLPQLTDGARDLPERQRTMRASIAWSYQLLAPEERSVARRLSAFTNNWTAGAASSVVLDETDTDGDALDAVLESLLEKNLLRRLGEGNAGPRFGMFETVREYLQGELNASGEAEAIRRRHALAFGKRAADVNARRSGPEQGNLVDGLEADYDNLRLAFLWAIDHDLEIARHILDGLMWLWYLRGYLTEGRRWLELLLSRTPGMRTSVRASALSQIAQLAVMQGDVEHADAWGEESVSIRRELKDPDLGYSLITYGSVAAMQGQLEIAQDRNREAEILFRECGNEWGVAAAVHNQGYLALSQGDVHRSERLLENALAIYQRLGDPEGVAGSFVDLGTAALARGDDSRAETLFRDALEELRRLGYRQRMAYTLLGLGEIQRNRGNLSQATALLDEALGLFRVVEDPSGAAHCLATMGEIALDRGDVHSAAASLHTCFAECGQQPFVPFLSSCLIAVTRLLAERDSMTAARLYGAAAHIRLNDSMASLSGVQSIVTGVNRERLEVQLRSDLGELQFEEAAQEGQRLADQEAIKMALTAVERWYPEEKHPIS